MAANDYIRTVNITPLSTSYSWDTPPSWITITRIGTSNDWTITLAANSGSARNATLTVRHANTTTVDTIAVSQNGVSSGGGGGPTATPIAPTPVPTSGSGAGPTATPIAPTPVPTATSPAGAGYALSFVDSSYTIRDDIGGAGSWVDLVYNITGATTPPTLVEKDSRISWTNRSGPSGGVGTIRLYSLMSAGDPPSSFSMSPDFKIAHPLSSSVTASIPGYIVQEDGGIRFVSPTATPSGGGCLIAGTKITLANNTVVNVEDLTAGTELFSTIFGDMPNTDNATILKAWTSQSPAISSTTTYLNSVNSYVVDKVYNINNGLITSSKDHLHIIKRDNLWTVRETRELVIGDILMSTTGEIAISTIDIINEHTVVYNLNVEPNDNYVANGLVTHNKGDGTGGTGGGCHIAGEMITLVNGETKAVENIQVGDQLLSFDVNGYNHDEEAFKNWSSHIDSFTGEFTSVEVIDIKVDTYSSYYNFNDGLLKITYEHPILIKDINNVVSWKIARDAAVGEFMLNENNQWILISTKSLVETITPFSTWTLDVETEDVYFANGILVHNSAREDLTKNLE